MPKFKNMSLITPCKNCPFRTDVPRFLGPGRYVELAAHLLDRGENFVCHKTVDYSAADEDDDGNGRCTEKTCTCAGAMIFMQKVGKPNQMMQVMERLGAFDPDRLNMDAPVYETREDFEQGVKS